MTKYIRVFSWKKATKKKKNTLHLKLFFLNPLIVLNEFFEIKSLSFHIPV